MSASRRPPRFSVWCRTRCGSGGQPGRSALDEVYGDPPIFFANTYATSGLKSLMLEGLSRVTGANAGGAAVIRLETSSGGGKTHNLIGVIIYAEGASIRKTRQASYRQSQCPRSRSSGLPASSARIWTWPKRSHMLSHRPLLVLRLRRSAVPNQNRTIAAENRRRRDGPVGKIKAKSELTERIVR